MSERVHQITEQQRHERSRNTFSDRCYRPDCHERDVFAVCKGEHHMQGHAGSGVRLFANSSRHSSRVTAPNKQNTFGLQTKRTDLYRIIQSDPFARMERAYAYLILRARNNYRAGFFRLHCNNRRPACTCTNSGGRGRRAGSARFFERDKICAVRRGGDVGDGRWQSSTGRSARRTDR